MNYLETIKNKFVEMNCLERIATMFFINVIVFFMFSMHCFVFTKHMFLLLALTAAGTAVLNVLIIDLFLDKKHKVYKKLDVAINVMAIITIINTIFQQLNINFNSILDTLNINDRFLDIHTLFNFRGTGSLLTIIYENYILIFTVIIIVSVIKMFVISDNEKHLSLVHKFRSFFNSFKQILTIRNENYGFLYKRIP